MYNKIQALFPDVMFKAYESLQVHLRKTSLNSPPSSDALLIEVVYAMVCQDSDGVVMAQVF